MLVNRYILTVQHDRGIITIKTSASSKEAAKKVVMATENCPERAILRCETPREYAQRQVNG